MVNLQVHDNLTTYILGSPPPTVPCPYCPRYFKAKSGCTRHIQAKHRDSQPIPEPHAPASDPATDSESLPVRISSSPQPSFYGMDPSPVPSDFVSAASPASHPSDLDIEPIAYLDIDDHQFDQGSPGGDLDDVRDEHVPDAPRRIICTYHPKLNGELLSSSSLIYIDIHLAICRADL
jgi:hypothetical protein